MAIQIYDGAILVADGKIAVHEDCCCGPPTSCPCKHWPPASWPCSGLNQTYNVSYNLKAWKPPKTSCDGEPDEVEHYNRTPTALPESSNACRWSVYELIHTIWPPAGVWLSDEGTWYVWFAWPPNAWWSEKGGNTPIGSYPDTECKGEWLTVNIMFTDIVVS